MVQGADRQPQAPLPHFIYSDPTMWHKTLGGSALAFALFLMGAPAGAAPQ